MLVFTELRSPGDDEFEGTLVRKHEWESTTKKASNRSWDKVYMVVRGQTLVTYKDQKSYKSSIEQTHKGESPLDLNGATVIVASDYTKKKHVFRVKCVTISWCSGAVEKWILFINIVIILQVARRSRFLIPGQRRPWNARMGECVESSGTGNEWRKHIASAHVASAHTSWNEAA